MAPLLRPRDILSDEEVAAAKTAPVLSLAQLHLLQQQVDALRRINIQLRVLKYRARTGQQLLVQQAAWTNGGVGRGPSGRGRSAASRRDSTGSKPAMVVGRGRGHGQASGRYSKRGRESDEDDSIVVRSSEEEEVDAEGDTEDGGNSREGQGVDGLDEYESADTSESEDDFKLPTVAEPRRTGRARRPSSAADLVGGSSDEGDTEAHGSGMQSQRQQQQAAFVTQFAQIGSSQEALDAGGQACSGRSGGGGSSDRVGANCKRQPLFRVVSDGATASDTAIQLPQLQPVTPGQLGGSCNAGADGAGGSEEEDAVCSVCGDSDAVQGNLILLCDGKGCSVAVHQLCYGVGKVPEGQWLCEACKSKLKPTAANCSVCPVTGNAVKKVTSLGPVVPAGKPKSVYCHLACALWVPEIELANHEHMAGVRLDKLTAVRVRLRCELCKQAGGGVVQCALGTCCRSFHVLCGRAKGQALQFRTTDGEPLAFCELHSRPAFEKLVEEIVNGKRPLQHHGILLED